ncbi:shikimate dehydrogenase [Parvularcula sp. LCG005]|uniref:shikimate dehydrogenase family protein n=1 Tax=Parvularcula sp. LCG005 TaxID=3078805 RepID=UPI002943B867|nr:shikimate dehydrogenase [Parvularcula sp. LCG005]WOI53314.1 shikimate dehydrogenase [Parvularcula sp. LCG005]
MVSRVGVIGHPISQTLSPFLHGRWLDRFGIDATYAAVDGLGAEQFESVVRGRVEEGWLGLNVTIPFKGQAVAIADEVSPLADKLGAANFLHFREGRIIADNYDAPGFAAAVEGSGWTGPRQTARVLGAGGAAPAVIAALQTLGFDRIEVTNRSAEKVAHLATRLPGIDALPWDERGSDLRNVDLLVNTTSLGMKGQPALEIEIDRLPDHAGVVDIITTPLETPLLAAARANGLFAMNGLPMLVHQAIPAFARWFGPTPDDPDAAIAFLDETLRGRS